MEGNVRSASRRHHPRARARAGHERGRSAARRDGARERECADLRGVVDAVFAVGHQGLHVGGVSAMTAINEFLDVANAFNSELKVAWVAWLAWGIGQAFWYRWERSSAGRPRVSSAARAPRKPASKRHKVAPVVGRLITPAHIEATPVS